MTLTVYKYEIPITDHFTVRLPRHAKILCFQIQHGLPQLWALVDPSRLEHTDRQFLLAGTGHPINESLSDLDYVGTWQMHDGDLVWHLFELLEAKVI